MELTDLHCLIASSGIDSSSASCWKGSGLVLSAVVISLSAEGNHHPFNIGHLNQPAEQCDEVAFTDRVPLHHPRHVSGEVAADGEAFDQLGVSGIEITLLVSNEANNLELPTATM